MNSIRQKKYMQVVEFGRHADVEDKTVYEALETFMEFAELLDMTSETIIIVFQFDNLLEYSEILIDTLLALEIEAVNSNSDKDMCGLIFFLKLLPKHQHRISSLHELKIDVTK